VKTRAHITLYGRVQNVSFRIGTQKQAILNSLKGWVKNEGDGTVEIIVEGTEENIKKLLGWCREGPISADVDDMKIEWLEPTNEFTTFSIRY
jgi:acylphosphatase